MKKVFIKSCFILLLLALCLLTAGCRSKGKEREEDDSDTLYVGYVGSSFPTSYMPWQSRDGIAPTVCSMLYSTLFSYNDETGVFEPGLAESWCYIDKKGEPILTEDGRVDYARLEEVYGKSKYIPIKLVLNKEARWSDGRPVTAEDIYFTFDLCANNALSNHAGALAWVTGSLRHTYERGKLMEQGIFTAAHNPSYSKYTFSEDETDTTVYLHLERSLGAVTTLFTTILILPEHIWSPIISAENPINSTKPNDALQYAYTHPVGCGPFRLDLDATNAQVIVLQRRDDYHLRDKADPSLPYYKVERIKFILYQEQNVAIFSILKGYIDVLATSVNPNYRTLFDKEEDLQVIESESSFCQCLVLNVNPQSGQNTPLRSLFSQPDFRRAIALAINQEDLIEKVKDGAAVPFSAGLISNKLTELYNPKADILSGDYEARLAEANTILDAIVPEKDAEGYRLLNGRRIRYEILGNPTEQDLVSFLQVQFQKIRIEVEYAAAGSSPEKTFLYTSKFDMTLQGVTFSLTTVDIMMKAHFVTLGTSSNYGRYEDPALEAKIKEMTSTINLDRKYELIREVQEMIAETYYKIPLYSSKIVSVARTDRWRGWKAVTDANAFNTDSLISLERVKGESR